MLCWQGGNHGNCGDDNHQTPCHTGQLSKRLVQQLPLKRDWEGLGNQHLMKIALSLKAQSNTTCMHHKETLQVLMNAPHL